MASLSGVIIRLHTEGGLAGLLKYVPFCAVLVSHSLRGKSQLFLIKCVGSRNYGMDTESLKFIFISKRVVSLYQGLNQVR